MRSEQPTNDPDDRIINAPHDNLSNITRAEPRDQRVTRLPNADSVLSDDQTVELQPGRVLITSKIAITAIFAGIGGVLGFFFAACGVVRGMVIPTLFTLRLHVDGPAGAFLEKTVEALLEGGLVGLVLVPILALERREPLGKPYVTLRGYLGRLLRMILPWTLGGALMLVATEWLNELTLWATGSVLTLKQKMLLMVAAGATAGAGVGLLCLCFPRLVRFLPFRKRFP